MKFGKQEIKFESQQEFNKFKEEFTKGILAIDTMKSFEGYFKERQLLTEKEFKRLLKKASRNIRKQAKRGSVKRE